MEPIPETTSTRATLLLAAATGVVVFLGYLPTVAREIPVGDSGELIAAAYTLGIPHPPGYPLWCLFASAFGRLVPGVSFTFGANLSSAAAGAAASGATAAVARALGCGAPSAFGAGLLAGFGKFLWAESTAAEVYPLNALLFAGLLLACLAPPSRRAAGAFGLLAGLSLTMHPIMRGLVPIALLHFLLENRSRPGRGRRLAAAAVGLLGGLLVLLYLPIRAAAKPPLNFENPVDLRGVSRLLGMTIYRSPEENVMVREPILLGLGARLAVLVREVGESLPLPALLLAGMGLLFGLWRSPLRAAALGAHFVAATVGIAIYCASRDSRLYPASYETYSLPAFLVLGVLVGAGIEGLVAGAKRLSFPRPRAVAFVLALLLGGWAYDRHRSGNDRSGEALPTDLGRNALETVEPGGILLAWGDQVLIPCLYQQIVLGTRPDVEIGTRTGRVDPALLRRYGAPTDGAETETLRLARAAAHLRPIYTNYFDSFPEESGLKCVPVGFLHRVVRKGTAEEAQARERSAKAWKAYRWRTLGRERQTGELREIEAFVRDRAAEHRLRAKDLEGAVEEWRELATLHPTDAAVLANVGTGLVGLGRAPEGKLFLERALALAPGDEIARTTLGGVLVEMGEAARAIHVLAPFLRRRAADLDSYLYLAKAARAVGDRPTVARALEAARKAFPDDPRPFVESALFHLEEPRDVPAALRDAERALALRPADPEVHRLLARVRAAGR
ncbi:MAG TPA: DUF2723 domain-containing protein [Planctomycetota bacterium]|jgi:hypothetical protein|nr:DUF2723 domain-containing protein [Planctomycetota bacterium]